MTAPPATTLRTVPIKVWSSHRRNSWLAGRRQEGFTLLDSLIVIVILGIIGMIAIPQFQGLIQETRLNEAAAEIVSGMQYAGSLAVRYGRAFGFQADAAGHWYKIYDNRSDITACTDQIPDDPLMDSACVVLNPLDKNWYIRNFNDMENYRAVIFTSANVIFSPDGHSGSADTVVTVSLGDRSKTITVDGATGRITVQ